MNKLSVFLMCIVVALTSCEGNNNKISDTKPEQEKMAAADTAKADTTKWIDNFEAFREALKQNDRKKVKTFFNFPVTQQVNNIWGIVHADSTKKFTAQIKDSLPFTEKDFDKYYDKLFTKIFIDCLLKIKSDELYKGWETSPPELKKGKVTYGLVGDVRHDTTLTLTFFSKEPYGPGMYDVKEFSIDYVFTILKNRKIKLNHISAAGS